MFGGDLPSNDAETLGLISNDEVLGVDQRATNSHQLFARGSEIAWVSDVPGSKAKYLAVFNLGDSGDSDVRVDWRQLGLGSRSSVRDLWTHKDLGNADGGYTFKLAAHASGLYRIQ
jgi:hypothetical protein